jgi:hypothetical protein
MQRSTLFDGKAKRAMLISVDVKLTKFLSSYACSSDEVDMISAILAAPYPGNENEDVAAVSCSQAPKATNLSLKAW